MSDKPLVSVIVIFLDEAHFIQEAIDSVLAQSYDAWELLLVDDGSTDASTTIARRCATEYSPRVRYLEHEGHTNRGMSASRNLGVKLAHGEYVAFLDADDVWLPNKLSEQVTLLRNYPEATVLYGRAQYWRSWTGGGGDQLGDYVPKPGLQTDRLYRPPDLLKLYYPFGKAPTPCPSDLIMRREAMERVGGFEEGFRGIYSLYEDQAFLSKVYLQEPVYVANACWIRYRLHPDSCVSTVRAAGQYHAVRQYYFGWLSKYLTRRGTDDPEIRNALRRVQWPYRHPHLYGLRRRMQRVKREVVRMRQVPDRVLRLVRGYRD